MVLSSVLLIVIVPLVLIVIAYFISRALFRIVMAVSTVLFVIVLIFGSFIVFDAYRFTETLEEGPTRFVFENRTIGIETNNGTRIELSSADFAEDALTTFDVQAEFIANNATARYESAQTSRNRTLLAIEAADPYASFAEALAQAYAQNPQDEEVLNEYYEEQLRDAFDDETQMRSYLFGELLSTTLESEGNDALLLGIREGTVIVEPHRPIITFIKRMPTSIMERSLDIEV